MHSDQNEFMYSARTAGRLYTKFTCALSAAPIYCYTNLSATGVGQESMLSV